MKKVLYITNIRVPYRTAFFNELAKNCDLTVLYERKVSKNRDKSWSVEENDHFKKVYLDGIKIGQESAFSFKVLKYILADYDVIILGCYSTPVQVFANIVMRVFGVNFVMNFDGEVFASDNSLKSKIKRFVIKGAKEYLIAGEKAANNLSRIVGEKKITTYYFSSLTEKEIEDASLNNPERSDYILVVGQYFEYKGLDVAAKAAKELDNINFKFVGMGKRTDIFIKDNIVSGSNIEVIPFLPKDLLIEEYKKCRALLLPSRQECWGLVVNEAAAYGTPIISTKGAGASVEFIEEEFSDYLVEANSHIAIVDAINHLINDKLIEEYSKSLVKKSKMYSIERSVIKHMEVVNGG